MRLFCFPLALRYQVHLTQENYRVFFESFVGNVIVYADFLPKSRSKKMAKSAGTTDFITVDNTEYSNADCCQNNGVGAFGRVSGRAF